MLPHLPAVDNATKLEQDSVEESTTIRLDAQLNYVGDSHVDVTCTVGSLATWHIS